MRGKPKILCKDHWTMVPCDISIHFEQSIRWYAVEKFWAELSDQVGCLSNFHCPNMFKHLPPIAAHNLCLSCCWLHPYKICIAVVCPRSNYCTNGKYPGCYPCKMMQICNVDIYIDVDMAPLTKKQPPFRFDFWFWILTWLLGTLGICFLPTCVYRKWTMTQHFGPQACIVRFFRNAFQARSACSASQGKEESLLPSWKSGEGGAHGFFGAVSPCKTPTDSSPWKRQFKIGDHLMATPVTPNTRNDIPNSP